MYLYISCWCQFLFKMIYLSNPCSSKQKLYFAAKWQLLMKLLCKFLKILSILSLFYQSFYGFLVEYPNLLFISTQIFFSEKLSLKITHVNGCVNLKVLFEKLNFNLQRMIKRNMLTYYTKN